MRIQPIPSSLVVRCALALGALATTACAGAAGTPGRSWARGWSLSASFAMASVASFSDGLGEHLIATGWGVDTQPGVIPIVGIPVPGTEYPVERGVSELRSFTVGRLVGRDLQVLLRFSRLDLGGQDGFDGSRFITLAGSRRSLALMVAKGFGRARLGGGLSLDRLTMEQESFPPFAASEAGASTRPGLDLFTDVRLWRRGPLMLGLGLEQHLGLPHEMGPFRIDDQSQVPAARLSPNSTTFTLTIGLGDSFQ